jgi:hypothetical protein
MDFPSLASNANSSGNHSARPQADQSFASYHREQQTHQHVRKSTPYAQHGRAKEEVVEEWEAWPAEELSHQQHHPPDPRLDEFEGITAEQLYAMFEPDAVTQVLERFQGDGTKSLFVLLETGNGAYEQPSPEDFDAAEYDYDAGGGDDDEEWLAALNLPIISNSIVCGSGGKERTEQGGFDRPTLNSQLLAVDTAPAKVSGSTPLSQTSEVKGVLSSTAWKESEFDCKDDDQGWDVSAPSFEPAGSVPCISAWTPPQWEPPSTQRPNGSAAVPASMPTSAPASTSAPTPAPIPSVDMHMAHVPVATDALHDTTDRANSTWNCAACTFINHGTVLFFL